MSTLAALDRAPDPGDRRGSCEVEIRQQEVSAGRGDESVYLAHCLRDLVDGYAAAGSGALDLLFASRTVPLG